MAKDAITHRRLTAQDNVMVTRLYNTFSTNIVLNYFTADLE